MDEVQQQSDDQYHEFDGTQWSSEELVSGKVIILFYVDPDESDLNNHVILVVSDNEGNDVSINWNKIKKVGEIILLGDSSITTTNASAQQGLRCPSCNFDNNPNSKFCESCGTKIGRASCRERV